MGLIRGRERLDDREKEGLMRGKERMYDREKKGLMRGGREWIRPK